MRVFECVDGFLWTDFPGNTFLLVIVVRLYVWMCECDKILFGNNNGSENVESKDEAN